VRRYLDDGDRLSEILFGLIMVLTFTSTARATLGESETSARDLLVAALGCNLAWGIIDGGMYIMNVVLGRAAEARERGEPPPPKAFHPDDFMGAFACGLLVIGATLPVSVPFMIFSDAYFALRLSNAILLVMLFLVGYQWGHYSNLNKWLSGFCFLVIGMALVAIAIALGG
jgi:hypothetical protein